MTKIIVTFIRHGESEDNLKSIWAGWKDAPLSELGQKQARALGQHLSRTSPPITHIYASPLLRAHHTGLQAQAHQSPSPSPTPTPPLTLNPHLREQHFGIAEGHPWVLDPPPGLTLEQMFATNIFPVLSGRHDKFPGGESLDDLRGRAELGIRECVVPHLPGAGSGEGTGGGEGEGVHVALASHGLAIGELVAALLRLDPHAPKDVNYTGLLNTAWTRAEVRVRDGHKGPIDPSTPPPLEVKVVDVNNKEHLDILQKEEGNATHEDVGGAQAKAKAFFGGQKV